MIWQLKTAGGHRLENPDPIPFVSLLRSLFKLNWASGFGLMILKVPIFSMGCWDVEGLKLGNEMVCSTQRFSLKCLYYSFYKLLYVHNILGNQWHVIVFSNKVNLLRKAGNTNLIGGTRTSNWFLNKFGRFKNKKKLNFF